MKHINMSDAWYWNKSPCGYRCVVNAGETIKGETLLPVRDVVPLRCGCGYQIPMLPEDHFKIVKINGRHCITDGYDNTIRALVFLGCTASRHEEVSLVLPRTTGKILAKAYAGSREHSVLQVAALLDDSESVTFLKQCRNGDEHLMYTWNGNGILRDHFWVKQQRRVKPTFPDSVMFSEGSLPPPASSPISEKGATK